jgi:glycerophosphoryl diester phosphodiesterase/HEAT repeat protein
MASMNLRWKRLLCALLLVTPLAHAGILRKGTVQLLCHRTANRDLPENTLESLALAARMGCDIIEVDVTRTLDGELVLNHDNFLDRFTNTTGEVEHTELRELDRMDFGAWRGTRFRGIHIAHFDDALRLARELNVRLYLDIKSKGIGSLVLASLAREHMNGRVIFGGEWDDIRRLDPRANEDPSASLQPGFTRDDVERLHKEGKTVIANFIQNGHETDLAGMRDAVTSGVDGIMVDYPRLGAEAVGRPVEDKLGRLTKEAEGGPSDHRVKAIRELSQFSGFPLQPQFLRWLQDPDESVSHEAALALVTTEPSVAVADLAPATHSSAVSSRRNAAWAIGSLAADLPDGSSCIRMLLPMLDDPDRDVVKEALLAISWCPASMASPVPAEKLLAFLSDPVSIMRGLAAVALAKHLPHIAAQYICRQLKKEEADAATYETAWAARGHAKLKQAEIDDLVELYRAQMKYIQALAMLPRQEAFGPLVEEAFRAVHDTSNVVALVAGYQLWDRLADDPEPAIEALNSSDGEAADRAQWALVAAGPAVLPAVRKALESKTGNVQRRLISVLAWKADKDAIPLLQRVRDSDTSDRKLIDWAIGKIAALGP